MGRERRRWRRHLPCRRRSKWSRRRNRRSTAFKRITINTPRKERLTLPTRPLRRPASQAIPPITEIRNPQTRLRLTGEEVIRERKVLKLRQITNTLRNRPRKKIISHIELLQTRKPSKCLRQRTHQLIGTYIEHRQVLQRPNFGRQARIKPIVHHNDLIQPRHVAQARRHTPMELIVPKHNDRHRRISKIIRQFESESVVVNKNGV